MIIFKPYAPGAANTPYQVQEGYSPSKAELNMGSFVIRGIEYTHWTDEFKEAIDKEIIWDRLSK